VPRIINVICDAALVFGYAEERRAFDARVILEVLDELETTGVLPPASSIPPARREPPAAVVAPAAASAPPFPVAAARPAPSPEPMAVATSGMTVQASVDEARLELQRREMIVTQREAELAEQRRVLAEEYRLLRAQRTAASAPADDSFRFQVAGGAPTTFGRLMADPFDTTRGETFWTRLKRFMLGVTPS
jgi:hypothetical protein